MAALLRWRSFVMGTAVLAGTVAAAPAAFAQVVPGTGTLINTDDFEDSKFSWIHNWPKSSKEEDEQIRHPLGGATNKRWFESPKRGSPDVLKWIETPPGGLEGSKGALYVRTRDSGIPGHPGRKQAQDDFILAAKPTTPAYQPNYTVRIFVPEWSQWEQRNGVSFGIRAGMQGPYEKEEEVNSVRRFFRGGRRTEKVTVNEPYYPGFFIQFNPKSMPGNKEGDHALILIRADSLGHEVPGPKIMQPGWWTLGMSVSPDSRCHFFASPGVDDLTAADHIYSSLPYGIPGKTFNTIFFNICSVDDGQTWSTPWIIDDPKVFIVDGRTPRQAPIAQQPKPVRTAALPTPPVQPVAPPPAQPVATPPAPAAVTPPAAPVPAVIAPPVQPAPLPIPAAPAAVIPAPVAAPLPAQASAAPTAPAGKPVVGEPLPPSDSYNTAAAPMQPAPVAQQPAPVAPKPAPVAPQPAPVAQQPAAVQQPQRPGVPPQQQRPMVQPQQRPGVQPQQQRPVAQPQQRPGVQQPQRPVAQQPQRPAVAPTAPVAIPPAVAPMPAAPAAATPVTVPAPAPMAPATVSVPPVVTPTPVAAPMAPVLIAPAPMTPAPVVQTPAVAPMPLKVPTPPAPVAPPVAATPVPMPVVPVLVPAVIPPVAPPAAPTTVAVPMTTPAPVATAPAPMVPAPLPAVPMTAAAAPIPLVIPPAAPAAPAPPPVKPAPAAAQPPKLFSAEDFITPPPRDSLPPAPPKIQ